MEDGPVDHSATLDAPFLLGTPRAAREGSLDRERALDRFLAGIERRALRIAQLALRNHAEAEDAVQDAMIRLVRHYAARPEEEWRPLFYRILGNRIIDFQRRERLRRAVTVIWRGSPDDERSADPVESAVDPRGRPDEALEGEELLARIRAQLRQHEQSDDAVFTIGPYSFKPASKLLLGEGGDKIRLTEKETAILKYLFRAGEKVVTREVLLQEVWGYNAGVTTHTLETHIYRLRQKIEADPSQASLLVTEAGGYKLMP